MSEGEMMYYGDSPLVKAWEMVQDLNAIERDTMNWHGVSFLIVRYGRYHNRKRAWRRNRWRYR